MLQWQESASGFEASRYTIAREGPNRWRLRVSERGQGEYRSASSAKVEAERLERLRRRNARLIRIGAGLAAVALLAVAAVVTRFETNPARAEAEALSVDMEAAHAAVQSGAAELAGYSVDGVRGDIVPLPTGVDLSVLLGEAGGECYVLYWHPATIRRGRVLADPWECEFGPLLVSPNENAYTRWVPITTWHFPNVQSQFDWEGLYPAETRQRGWYFPALIVLSIAALWLVSRAAVTLLDGGGRTA